MESRGPGYMRISIDSMVKAMGRTVAEEFPPKLEARVFGVN
jgi:hypothetical protein